MKTLTQKRGPKTNKTRRGESLKKLKGRVSHDHCISGIDRQQISEEDTFLWLSRRDLKGETESEITAAQYQALQKIYATKILQTERDNKCKLWQTLDERTDHIISAFLILAKEQHIKLRYRVCAQLHCNICKEIGVKFCNEY
jgi:hypothetical protein